MRHCKYITLNIFLSFILILIIFFLFIYGTANVIDSTYYIDDKRYFSYAFLTAFLLANAQAKKKLKMKLFNKEKYPNSEYMSKYSLYLPSGLALIKGDIEYVCKKVNKILS